MINIGELAAKLTLDTTEYYRGLDNVERSSASLGERMTRGLATVGTALTAGVTLPLVGIGTTAAKVAADFESQMNVLTVAARSSGTGLEDLRQAALAVGADTELIGISAAEAADAMTNFYKAGLDTTDIFGDLEGYLEGNISLTGALRAAVDLAAASELDLAQASDVVAIAMATFGLSAEDAGRIADSFVGSADASLASVGDLAQAMINFGPTAASFGFTLEQANTALALLSTRGIKGAEAGTALKSMLTNMMSNTNAVKDAWRDLGVSLYDSEGAMRALPDVIGDLETAMAGMTEQQRNQYIQTLAGTYGMKALQTLLAEGKSGWDDMTASIEDAATAQEVANARTQGFHSAMEQLQGVIETLLIQVGTPLIENFLTPAARWLGEMAGSLSERLTPALADFLVKAGLVVAGAGPLALLLAQLPKLIGFLTGPVGLIAGVIGLGIAFELQTGIISSFAKYIGAVLEDGDTLNDWLTHLPKAMQPAAKAFGELVDDLAALVKYIGAVLADGDYLNDWLTHLPEAIRGVVVEMGKMIALLAEGDTKGAFGLFQTWIAGGIRSIDENKGQWVADIGKRIGDLLGAAAAWVSANIGPRAAELWAQVRTWVEDAWAEMERNKDKWAAQIGQGLKDALDGAAAWLAQNVGDKVELPAAFKGLIDEWNEIATDLQTVWDTVTAYLTPTIDQLHESFGNMLDGLSKLGPSWQRFWDTIKPVIDGLAKLLGGAVILAVKLLGETVAAVFDSIPGTIENVLDTATTFLETVETTWNETVKLVKAVVDGDWNKAWKSAENIAAALVTFVGTSLTGLIDTVKTWGGNLLRGVRSALEDLPGDAGKFFTELFEKADEELGKVKAFLDDTLPKAAAFLQEKFDEYWPKIQEAVTDVTDTLWPVLDGLKEFLFTDLPDAASELKTKFEEYWPKVQEAVSTAWDTIKPWLEALEDVIVAIKDSVVTFASTWDEKWNAAKQKITDIGDALKTPIEAVKGAIDDVISAVNSLVDLIANPFTITIRVPTPTWPTPPQWLQNLWNGITGVPSGPPSTPPNVPPTNPDGSRRFESVIGGSGLIAGGKALLTDFTGIVDQLARVARAMIDVARDLFAEVGDEEQRKVIDKQMELFNQLAASTRGLTDAYAALAQELPEVDTARITSVMRVARELMGELLIAARELFGDASAEDLDKRLPAVEAFASLGSKLGSFVSGVVGAWGTLGGELPPVPDDLRQRIGALLGVVAVVADEIEGMTARDWANVAALAAQMQPVMDIVSGAARALQDMAAWKPTPGMGQISTEILKWAVSVVEFLRGHAAQHMGDEAPQMDVFGDAVGAAMSVLSDTAQALQTLAQWKPTAGMGEISTNLAKFAVAVVELMAGHAQKVLGDEVPNITAFGEAAGAAMAVLSDTAQALMVLKQWTPTAGMGAISTNVAKFAVAVVELIVSLAKRFDQEGLDAAKRMAEAQTPIMQAIQSTVLMMQALKEWEGAPNLGRISTNVALFAAAVIDLMVSLATRFQQEGLDAAKAMSEAAGPVMDALSGTLSLMAGLKEWQGAEGLGVKSSNVIKFAVAIVDFVIALAQKFDAEGIAAAQRFATAAGPVMSALESALNFMNGLKEWEGAPGLGVKSTNIIKFAVAVVDLVRALAAQFSEEGLAAAAELGDTIGRVTAGLKTALDLLNGLRDYTEVPETNVLQFEQDLLFIMQRLRVWLSGPLATLADETVTAAAQAIGVIAGGLRGAVDLLNGLRDYTAVPETNVLQFEQDLTFLLQRMIFWLTGPLAIYADEVVEKAGRTIGVVLGGLGDALGLLKGLKEYTRPTMSVIEDFVADVTKTFRMFADWVLLEFADGVPDVIAKFGAAASSLFSGLTSALTLLKGLKDYTQVPQQAMDDFMADVQRIVDAFVRWVGGRFGDKVDEGVVAWGDAMSSLFGGLSSALKLLLELPKYVPPAQSAMDRFVDDVLHMMVYFISIMPPLDDETAKAVTAFGSTIGALFDGLASALEVLQGLVWYVRPSQTRMDNFASDVKALFEKFAAYAKTDLVTSSTKAVTEFGNALGALSGGLGAALSLFEKLMSANFDAWLAKPAGPGQSASPFEKKLQQFNEALHTAIVSWNNWIINTLDKEAIALVGSFSDTLKRISEGFGAALQLLIDLNEEGLPSMERLQQYLDLVLMLFRAFLEGQGDQAGLDDVPGLVKRAGEQVIGALGDIGAGLQPQQEKWRLWGSNMMKDGLVAGIEQGLWASATRLKGAGTGAAQQLLGGFKTTLGIASPSRAFMEAAAEIPTGIALALDAGRSKVGSALDGLLASAGMDSPSVEVNGRKETHVYFHLDGNGLAGLSPSDRRAILDDLAKAMRMQGISAARA
jgi:TP901 family phage tail tape measure protein